MSNSSGGDKASQARRYKARIKREFAQKRQQAGKLARARKAVSMLTQEGFEDLWAKQFGRLNKKAA